MYPSGDSGQILDTIGAGFLKVKAIRRLSRFGRHGGTCIETKDGANQVSIRADLRSANHSTCVCLKLIVTAHLVKTFQVYAKHTEFIAVQNLEGLSFRWF